MGKRRNETKRQAHLDRLAANLTEAVAVRSRPVKAVEPTPRPKLSKNPATSVAPGEGEPDPIRARLATQGRVLA